jgi:allantoin racemase
MGRLLIINPNSNASVTQGLRDALELLEGAQGLDIDCVELADGPFGIETDEDRRSVVPLLVREISSQQADYDVFIIACYCDPGLTECRAVSGKPVLGINESAAVLSASLGAKFGVLALGPESIERHIAYVREIGMQVYHAGERPLNITVDESANDPNTLQKIIETGRELIDEDGAETLVLGCAGMARHRQAAEEALGVPVIDPVLAAATLAVQVLQDDRS